MAEYIGREALRQEIDRIYQKHFAKSREKFVQDVFKAFFKRIDKAPAADVVPVRHGRWIPFHSTAAGDIQYCSACDIGCTWRPNYCPNCGALMDLEGGNT